MGKASRKKRNARPESVSQGEPEDHDTSKTSRVRVSRVPRSTLWSGLGLAISIGLVVANLIVYAAVRQFGFVNSDDPVYVTANSRVLGALSWANIEWAFTEGKVPYWHPLTFLSHMLDVQLYGTNAAGHHMTSVVLHIASSVMLFAVMWQLTGAMWRSAALAALFSLHPLRVESVAWIAERKDVLSTFFWIATMWAYVQYVSRPDLKQYAVVAALFALGLMAKPMIVTLPFALLLLDYWPLERLEVARSARRRGTVTAGNLVREKIPLFALAALASLVTFAAQRSIGAVNTLEAIPLSLRLANALHSYVAYVGDLLWPTKLAALYPYPTAVSPWGVVSAICILAAVSVSVFLLRDKHRYLIVGWLWYLGTLLPVIGLIQVGPQARADRFTYVPHIGLLIMVVWGTYELARRLPNPRVILTPLTAAAIGVSAILSFRQVGIWRDTKSLWEHTLSVTRDNGVAHYNLGVELSATGRTDDAITHLSEAVRLEPDFSFAHNRLALALDRKGDKAGSLRHFAEVVRLLPNDAEAHANLGVSLAQEGKYAEAIEEFSQAVRLNPAHATARQRLDYLRRAIAEKSSATKPPDSASAPPLRTRR